MMEEGGAYMHDKAGFRGNQPCRGEFTATLWGYFALTVQMLTRFQ